MFKLTPNSIVRDKSKPLEIKEVAPGMYVVTNAYEGHYEYFKGRPLPKGSCYDSQVGKAYK